MDETDYHRRCDALFADIESFLEETDADFDTHGGIIEGELPDGGKIIINRQPPMQEVWVATPGGGHHFRWRDNAWRHTRQDGEIMQMLRSLFA